ncbi:Peptidase M23 [Caenorhabditis elegans]|uniref:Peptidase M23 n=1 Tax=Caenorhabditis elegans TaxID=6239 RepID=H2KZK8_CAEEL|nr:Peptidase M23 [Caenorhabditis elegans]CCD68634.1 Peptidase M23 [Caenorhabditis elegans]|eukprot:NP_001021235.1 Uncharacterized protein CELE_E02H9.3 [Caenorhabditis elegans]
MRAVRERITQRELNYDYLVPRADTQKRAEQEAADKRAATITVDSTMRAVRERITPRELNYDYLVPRADTQKHAEQEAADKRAATITVDSTMRAVRERITQRELVRKNYDYLVPRADTQKHAEQEAADKRAATITVDSTMRAVRERITQRELVRKVENDTPKKSALIFDIRLNISREMIPEKIVHFEAVEIAPQAPNERFANPAQKVGSGFSTTAKKPEPIVGTGFSLASRTESPKPNSTVVGKRFQRPQTPKQNTKVVGSGFPSPQKQVTPANNNKVAGSGFPKPPKKEEKIVGTGFQPPKKDKNSEKQGQIVGEGFTTSQTKEEKQRAVVTRIDEKRPGLYYLWNLDSKTEGLFKTTKYVLALGHHFEGTFQKQEDGRCVCKEYIRQITELLHGGINDKEKLFLTVKITKFTPAGVNQKFSTGTAKYIGELLEGRTDETKLTAGCIGKTVKIERRRVGEKDYVWMVTKIL